MPNFHIMKTHLKKEDGIKKLVKRAIETVRKRTKIEADVGQCPQELISIVHPIKDKMTTLKQKVMTEEDTIKHALEGLDMDKLKVLKRVFANVDEDGNRISSNKILTEDKLIQTAPYIMQDLDTIDGYIRQLNSLKDTVLCTYIECYGLSYHQCTNGLNVNFNNEQFVRDIQSALDYQTILRRVSQRNRQSEDNTDDADRANAPEGNNSMCVLC